MIVVCLVAFLGLAAPEGTIAEGTAVETLSAFQGEYVLLTKKDGSQISGTLKSVSGAAAIVLQADGVVVSLKPADVIRLRVGAQPTETPEPTWPRPQRSTRFDWKVISPRLQVAATRTGDVAVWSSDLPAQGCTYVFEESGGVRSRVDVDTADGEPTLLIVRPPTAGSALVGCGRRLEFSADDASEIRRLLPQTPPARSSPQVRKPMTRASPTASITGESAPVVLVAKKKYDDFEWSRTAAIVTASVGSIAAVATSLTGLVAFDASSPERIRLSSALYTGSAIVGGVTSLTSLGFGLKAYFDWSEAERIRERGE